MSHRTISTKRLALSWLLALAALVGAGPVAGSIVGRIAAPDGGPDASMFINASLMTGVLATALALVIALAMGALATVLTSRRMGLFTAGLTLAWPAWSAGSVEGMLRTAQSSRPLMALSLEGLLLGAVGVGMCWLLHRVGRNSKTVDHDRLLSRQGALGVLAAFLVGGVVAWIIAREGLKGQTLAAASIAAMFGATVARVLAQRAPVTAFYAAMALLAAVGPLLGARFGGADIIARMYTNELFPLTRIAPLDWLAGALIGVPIGLAWGASLLEKRMEE